MADILDKSNMNLHVQTNASSVKNNSSHFDQEESVSNGVSEAKPSKKAHMESKEVDVVNLSKDDLQLFEHQVAGHGTAEKGLLKHKLGHILKPLQGPPKGTREVNFYQKVFSSEESQEDCYNKLREFVPKFHGVACLKQDIPNGSGDSTNGETENDNSNRYLLLDDVLKDFKKPCVVDLKIGSQTWSPDASGEKIKQEKSKYKGTKFTVGICLTGMIHYDVRNNFEMHKAAKEFVKSLNPTSLRDTLKQFLNHEKDSKSAHLSSILLEIVCEKLKKIQEIFEAQKSFRLYGSSILIAYDADFFNSGEVLKKGGENSKRVDTTHVPIRVFLIDFAHFHPGEYATVDENYLFGLRNLIQIFCDIAENT